MYVSLYTPNQDIVVPIIFLPENRFLYPELKYLFQLYAQDNDAYDEVLSKISYLNAGDTTEGEYWIECIISGVYIKLFFGCGYVDPYGQLGQKDNYLQIWTGPEYKDRGYIIYDVSRNLV